MPQRSLYLRPEWYWQWQYEKYPTALDRCSRPTEGVQQDKPEESSPSTYHITRIHACRTSNPDDTTTNSPRKYIKFVGDVFVISCSRCAFETRRTRTRRRSLDTDTAPYRQPPQLKKKHFLGTYYTLSMFIHAASKNSANSNLRQTNHNRKQTKQQAR